MAKLSCKCQTWARDFSEMANTAHIQPSAHHPRCEHYALIQYHRLIIDGRIRIIDLPKRVHCFVPEDGTPYEIESVSLTLDQFQSLPGYEP